jgi:hypothetical protein
MKMYLLLPEEVPDLDGCVGVGDGGVDGEVSVDEAHLVAVSLGDAGDEVVDVGDGCADGSHGAAGAEPGVDLELAAAVLELEVEVEVLEVAGQLAARPLHSHNLGSHLHGDLLGDIHRLRSEDGLHRALLLLRRPTCEGGGGGATAAEETKRSRFYIATALGFSLFFSLSWPGGPLLGSMFLNCSPAFFSHLQINTVLIFFWSA